MVIEYHRNEDFVIIIVKDKTDRQIFKKKISLSNKKEYFNTMKSIAEKYGFKSEIDIDKSVNNSEEQKKDKKINWWNSNF